MSGEMSMERMQETLNLVLDTKRMARTSVAQVLADEPFGQVLRVCGWVRTCRVQGGKDHAFAFVHINDGSCLKNLQAVVHMDRMAEGAALQSITTGSSAEIVGKIVPSRGKQTVEISALRFSVLGDADAATYPIAKKEHTLEFLRSQAHFRVRTNVFGAVMRVRHALSHAIHQFYHERNFYHIHAPVITASDCEGAGEMFQVTTLLDGSALPLTKDGSVDYDKDFFGTRANLTVSGQLNAEVMSSALGNVYTFAPTFRAENSNTSRHLAEFWMVEPEISFAGLPEVMDLAEDMLHYCLRTVLTDCADDLELLEGIAVEQEKKEADALKKAGGKVDKKNKKPKLRAYLQSVLDEGFKRVTYTEAVDMLIKCEKAFEVPVSWGVDLTSEHEKYLVAHLTKAPTFVTDYPKEIKSFYMRMNDDGKTVAAVDMLVPHIGELIGGSAREERLDRLEGRMVELGMNPADYSWYMDLRRYGSVPHGGFGLGFERLVMMCTGMENIRDVIPFPRYPRHALY